jgi:hypothetical protein
MNETATEMHERIETAATAMKDCAAQIVTAQYEPRSFMCRRRGEMIVLALVTIPSRETPLAYWVSTDGDDSEAVAVPKSIVKIVEREVGGLFILATMKAWVAIDRRMSQANVPGLIKSRTWTDEQRQGWKRLQARITRVRRALIEADKPLRLRGRGIRPLLNRNQVA